MAHKNEVDQIDRFIVGLGMAAKLRPVMMPELMRTVSTEDVSQIRDMGWTSLSESVRREIVHSMSAHDKQRWSTVVRGSRTSALPEIAAYRRGSSRVPAPCSSL